VATVAIFFANSSLSSPLLCFASDEIVQVHLMYGLWADGQHLWGTWQHLWWNSLLCYDAIELQVYDQMMIDIFLMTLFSLLLSTLLCEQQMHEFICLSIWWSCIWLVTFWSQKLLLGLFSSLCYLSMPNFCLPKKCHDSRLIFLVCLTSAGSCLGWCTWCNGNIRIYSKYLNIGLLCV
jgi:hypothetical protein